MNPISWIEPDCQSGESFDSWSFVIYLIHGLAYMTVSFLVLASWFDSNPGRSNPVVNSLKYVVAQSHFYEVLYMKLTSVPSLPPTCSAFSTVPASTQRICGSSRRCTRRRPRTVLRCAPSCWATELTPPSSTATTRVPSTWRPLPSSKTAWPVRAKRRASNTLIADHVNDSCLASKFVAELLMMSCRL